MTGKPETPTGSMRLRPAARRPDPSPPAGDDATATAGARALDELLELHSEALVGLCRECITPAPCQTRRLLDVVAGTPTTPKDESQ